MKKLHLAVLLALVSTNSVAATVLSLDSALTGWTTEGSVTATNANVHLDIFSNNGIIPYDIAPATGTYMAELIPAGANNSASVPAIFGVDASQITSLFDSSFSASAPTNFAYMSKSLTLQAGTSYTFYWAYASQDYTPFADGVFYSISNGSNVKNFTVLARTAAIDTPITTGTAAYPTGVKILSSYGSTAWIKQTFTVSANGTYTISFGDFNAGDTSVNPIMFISDLQGTILGQLATFQGPSVEDTQASLHASSQRIRNIFNIATISNNFANMNTYDCNLFDSKGLCISAGGRYTNVDSPNSSSTSAVVVVGYKATPNIRIGGFLDQNIDNNTPTGVHISNKNPMMGAFAVWNKNADGLGVQVKLANAYQDKDVNTTRDIIGTSEAGTGSTTLNTQSYLGELSYAFTYKDKTLLRPYLALRRTIIKQDAYTEDTSASVTAPLTYAQLEDRSTTALLGIKLNQTLTPKATLTASLGIEQDLSHRVDQYAASGVSGLTSENFNDSIKRTRPVASLGAYYAISKSQRIAGDIYYQQLPFQSSGSTTAYFNYTIGF